MAIDSDPLEAAGGQLVDRLLEAVDGYGENANVTSLALVARVRLLPAPAHPVNTGQTLVFANVAPGLSEEDTRRYLAHALEEALGLVQSPRVDLESLPSLDDD